MDTISKYFMNNTKEVVTVSFVLFVAVLCFIAGCAGSKIGEWKTIKRPPIKIDAVVAVDSLYEVLKPSIDSMPQAKEITRKVLSEVKSKIPLLSDGQITINDAFTEVLLVTPAEYKPFIIALKLIFNNYYGDYGAQIPAEQIARIETLKRIIELLERKLGPVLK